MDENTIAVLTEPFPPEVVRERDGAHGQRLRYVPSAHVVRRLNTAFQHRWSFTIQEWQTQGEEIIVIGELQAGGIRKQGVGGATITKSREAGKVINLADDLKGACADCLKRCAMLCGCALHLYLDRDGNTRTKAPRNHEKGRRGSTPAPSTPENTPGPARITERQLRAVLALAESKSAGEVSVRTQILSTYSVPLEQLDRRQASEVISALNNGGLEKRGVGGAQ